MRGKQYGVGTKDGCTLMAASIEAFMESNPGSIDIAGDTMNAFNSFDRSELWPTLLAKFPNLVAYIVLTYGDAAPVFFKEGETLTTILNSVGSRQGCALGSYLFAIALHNSADSGCGISYGTCVSVLRRRTLHRSPC